MHGHGSLALQTIQRRPRHNPVLGTVGQRGDEVNVARFVADQRTMYRVPHTVTCAILGISISWFQTGSPGAHRAAASTRRPGCEGARAV